MEEYCRFGLNNLSLASQAKGARHRLCEAIKSIDPILLISSRDADGDVGRAMKVDGQLQRTSVEDCFAAASKRASEALRALAESTQAIEPQVAAIMEELRFKVYSLEKRTVLLAYSKQKFKSVRLCVLINATQNTPESNVLSLIHTCVENGADCLQLRAKGLSDAEALTLADQFTSICKKSNVVSIINDRIDIALLTDADGVHLGQDDLPAERSRQLVHKPLIIGVSTHNLDELQKAIDSECDYVGLGPVYSSPTKPSVKVSGLDYIQQAIPIIDKAGIHHLAIGGINQDNIGQLLNFGIQAIAVSASIVSSKNPAESCMALKKALSNSHS